MRTFAYDFYHNNTFHPTQRYCHFDGYVPGAFLDKVYSGEVDGVTPKAACEKLYVMFNTEHPADYKLRSMSVGDVLMLTDGVCVYWFSLEIGKGFVYCADPTHYHERIDGTCHMNVYHQNADLFENLLLRNESSHFLKAVERRNAQKKGATPVGIDAYEATLILQALEVTISDNPIDARARLDLKKKLRNLGAVSADV